VPSMDNVALCGVDPHQTGAPLADVPHVPYIYTEWRVPPSRVGRQSTGLRRLSRSASDERGGGPCTSMGAAPGRVAMHAKRVISGKAEMS
jgi:hypothetical protein